MKKLALAVALLIGSTSLFAQTGTKSDVPAANIKSLDGKAFNTATINNDGKPFIIDFWATWCIPCISQFPHSKKLSDESKDLPIEFIYLCTSESSDTDKWKTKIAEYKLSGTHIFVEKSIESSLMNIFSASGYPTYIFINRDGEYQPGVLKRPSELNKKELAELLK